MNETTFDSKRRLCPDGSCVGVIRADGRCSVCGRTASGKPDLSMVDPVAAGGDDVDETEETEAVAQASSGDDGFDAKRRLCDDGSCVGVIGADGRCSVCGQAGS